MSKVPSDPWVSYMWTWKHKWVWKENHYGCSEYNVWHKYGAITQFLLPFIALIIALAVAIALGLWLALVMTVAAIIGSIVLFVMDWRFYGDTPQFTSANSIQVFTARLFFKYIDYTKQD